MGVVPKIRGTVLGGPGNKDSNILRIPLFRESTIYSPNTRTQNLFHMGATRSPRELPSWSVSSQHVLGL